MKKFFLASVVALSVFVGAQSVSAMTAAEAEAIVSALGLSGAQAASIRALATPATPAASLTRQLGVGASGADVSALQTVLIKGGFLNVAAPTGYFGPATKAAVAAYQAKNGISATGYVGPMTLAKLNASVVVAPTPTPSVTPVVTSGEEGQLKNIDTLGGVESTIEEGDTNQKVLGAEVEAKDSDVTITRVDVDLTNTGSGSKRPTRYFDSISLMIDGKKVATMDASDLSKDNNLYSARFTGLKSVVTKDETAEIYVVVNAVDAIDSADNGNTWSVEIPENGIRAIDGAGISDTYVSSSDNIAETFSVGQLSGVELKVTKDTSSPKAATVEASDTDSTTGVVLAVAKLEAKGSDLVINDIPVTLTLSSSTAQVKNVVKRVYLYQGSKELDSQSATALNSNTGVITFTDLNLDLAKDETTKLTVKVDVENVVTTSGDAVTFANGDSLKADFTSGNVDAIDAEDSQGDTLGTSKLTGSVVGENQTFYADGIGLVLKNVTISSTRDADSTNVGSVADITVKFDVTAFGEDAYILNSAATSTSNNKGVRFTMTGDTYSGAASTQLSSTADLQDYSYLVTSGSTETFTVKITLNNGLAAGTAGNFGVALSSVLFGSTDSSSVGDYTVFTAGLSDLKLSDGTKLSDERVYLQ